MRSAAFPGAPDAIAIDDLAIPCPGMRRSGSSGRETVLSLEHDTAIPRAASRRPPRCRRPPGPKRRPAEDGHRRERCAGCSRLVRGPGRGGDGGVSCRDPGDGAARGISRQRLSTFWVFASTACPLLPASGSVMPEAASRSTSGAALAPGNMRRRDGGLPDPIPQCVAQLVASHKNILAIFSRWQSKCIRVTFLGFSRFTPYLLPFSRIILLEKGG